MKTCTKCHRDLPETEFYYRKDLNKFESWCNNCKKEYMVGYHQQWYAKNKERRLKQKIDYYYKNKDEASQRSKRYRKKNREKIAKHCREYRNKNKDKIRKKSKEYRQNNKDKIKRSLRLRRLKRRVLFEDFTIEEWRQKVEQTKGICPRCNRLYSKGYGITMDHNPPISKAQPGFHYKIDNVQPMCCSCNCSKSDSL